MTTGDEIKCSAVRDAVESAGILESESEVEYATKFAVALGASCAEIHVFTTGEMHVEGAESALKTWCEQLEASIEHGSDPLGVLLPTEVESGEIEVAPAALVDKFPDGDEVVQWYFAQSLKAVSLQHGQSDSLAGAALMLGAASERALLMLIETYAARINNDMHRKKFLGRTTDRTILAQFEKFRQSYKRATSHPVELPSVEDLDKQVETSLGFCRHLRDDAGQPCVISDADAEAALAKREQFPGCLERIYDLIRFFNANEITV